MAKDYKRLKSKGLGRQAMQKTRPLHSPARDQHLKCVGTDDLATVLQALVTSRMDYYNASCMGLPLKMIQKP